MTDYQNHWNYEVKTLLKELNAPDSLYKNIAYTIHNSGLSGIYINQVINALRIGHSIKEGHLNLAFVSPMQSGKSGTMYFLCNFVLPELNLINDFESVIFVTSMRDTDLFDQNCKNLQKDFYDCVEGISKPSNIKVVKISDFFNLPNPYKLVNDYNAQLIIRDEDQYGCGIDSSFYQAFYTNLRERISTIKLLSVSATPYDILDAHFEGKTTVDVTEGVKSPKYYGITQMLLDDKIEDIPKSFRPLQSQGKKEEKIYSIHPKVSEYVNHLLFFSDGLGIIRESNLLRALELSKLLKKKHKNNCSVICIGSNNECDFNIYLGMKEVSNLVLRRGKRVILIVVQALTAGKDLGINLKEKVRFGIEPRDKQLANGAQGITGRFCGYHNNRSFKLLASRDLLECYSEFEQDWEIYGDPEWKNRLASANARSITTQTKIVKTQRAGTYLPITSIKEISYASLLSEDARKKLNFISDDAYYRLLDFFDDSFFNANSKGVKFRQSGVTVRISSSYNQSSNRVFKNWNCSLKDNFGNVFFNKKKYDYGLLISNFPVDDARNKIGFCGIKIITSGTMIMRNKITDTDNRSMYNGENL